MMSLKYWFARIYRSVHPIVKPKTAIKVPKNFPNKNPEIKVIGVANPKSKIQMIVNRKNKI